MPAHTIIEATQTAGGDDRYFDLRNSLSQYRQIVCLLLLLLLGFALSPHASLVVTLPSSSILFSSQFLCLDNPLSQFVALCQHAPLSFNYVLYLKISFLHFFPICHSLKPRLPPSFCFAVHHFILPIAILFASLFCSFVSLYLSPYSWWSLYTYYLP